jgi:large-conductance mechanosensitive channel
MAELMQPNIVGNFLNAYQSGLERQEAQKAAEPPAPPEDVVLLREIRDALTKR